MADIFVLDPAQEEYARGNVLRPATTNWRRSYAFIAIVTLLLASFSTFVGGREWLRIRRMEREGIVLPAVLVDKQTIRSVGRRSSTYHRLTLAVEPGGPERAPWKFTETVSHDSFNAYQVGSPLHVRLVASDPSLRGIEETFRKDWGRAPLYASLFTTAVLALAAFVAGKTGIAHMRERRLFTSCQLIRGEAIAVDSQLKSGQLLVSLEYRFTTPGGRVLQGREDFIRNDLRDKPDVLSGAGAPVMVAYRSDEDFRVL